MDAMGFLDLGGFFVSFMSGNTTRLGIGIGAARADSVLLAVSLVTLFVSGVVLGSLLSRKVGEGRRRSAVLAGVAVLLAIGAVLHSTMHVRFGTASLLMAMGMANTVLRRDSVSVGLTYMTGNLVRMGNAIADSFHGGPKKEWLRYFIIWLGLVGGAAAGSVSYAEFEMNGLWLGVAFAAALAAWAVAAPSLGTTERD